MGTADLLRSRLAAGEVVIIDGGMGTQLQAEGVPMDKVAWSARAKLERPEVVQRVHEAYIRAGAQVIIANTFAASRAGLEPAGLGGHIAEANTAAVGAALAAREAAVGGPVVVAGSMSSFCPAAKAAGRAAHRPPGGLRAIPGFLTWLTSASRRSCSPRPCGSHCAGDDRSQRLRPCRRASRHRDRAACVAGITPARREDGSLGTPAELGDGDSFEDLLAALASPALAAVTVMHCDPGVIPDAIGITAATSPGRLGPTPRPAAGHHRTGSAMA